MSTSMTSGDAITINTNNVTLDCNHFKIGGLAAGTGTVTNGVRAASRFNATVRNCNIRGFYRGVYLNAGGGHLVENSSFDGNTLYGIYVISSNSTIRNNLVIDTGGSTASTSLAAGIFAAFGVDIINNTVNGVAPTGTDTSAIGINTDFNGSGSISGNRVRGLAPTGAGVPYGIYTTNTGRSIIRDNDVQGPGPGVAGSLGIRCFTNEGTVLDNAIAGFQTGIANCFTGSNVVNSN
ncbi:right-handed parallel beta-helix repeat-containing protein [Marilutibacter alkalisoli]|uniref:right-handed parallel beta-helix repeat-containing protein n=1 Tax=Marilutibacter alkalisoli TaxID=2591633 RepID=UPI00141F62C8|nr:right-handed parallel beta-helix repeat-containing protein [Lysobacter alkalisoli]